MVSSLLRPIIYSVFKSFFLLFFLHPMFIFTGYHESFLVFTSFHSLSWTFLSFSRYGCVIIRRCVDSMLEFQIMLWLMFMIYRVLLFGFYSKDFPGLAHLRLIFWRYRRNNWLHALLASHSIDILNTVHTLSVRLYSEHSFVNSWSRQDWFLFLVGNHMLLMEGLLGIHRK